AGCGRKTSGDLESKSCGLRGRKAGGDEPYCESYRKSKAHLLLNRRWSYADRRSPFVLMRYERPVREPEFDDIAAWFFLKSGHCHECTAGIRLEDGRHDRNFRRLGKAASRVLH